MSVFVDMDLYGPKLTLKDQTSQGKLKMMKAVYFHQGNYGNYTE